MGRGDPLKRVLAAGVGLAHATLAPAQDITTDVVGPAPLPGFDVPVGACIAIRYRLDRPA